MFSNSEPLDSEMKWKKEKNITLFWNLLLSLMIGNQDYGGICKLNIGKPNRWMFLISEPLHNENEKKGNYFTIYCYLMT